MSVLQKTIVVIHCHNDQTSSFCFLETCKVAKKGPNTVCSLIYDFVMRKVEEFPNLKIVTLSDLCGGQNNPTVVMFTTWLSRNLNLMIEHKYLLNIFVQPMRP